MSQVGDHARDNPSGVSLVESPPTTIGGILRRLGPGLVIAAAIVGSGELIATTKTGAEAGFALLWLILVGCVIKVFAQVEFGRYAITEGRGTMEALNLVPGPRLRVNWLVWYWVFMALCSFGQLGGIVGIVGQTLSIPLPITGDFNEQSAHFKQVKEVQRDFDRQLAQRAQAAGLPASDAERNNDHRRQLQKIAAVLESEIGKRPAINSTYTWDDVYWSGIVTAITSAMLVIGRYRLVQTVSTILVAGFTAVTVFNLAALQTTEQYAVSWDEIWYGLSLHLPESTGSTKPLLTALATFGIIGVGATELLSYPYWCLERGYARFAGPRDASSAWADRARGWLNVMRWDSWCSMIIYTFATLAFYLLGATVLNRTHQVPDNEQVVPTLTTMYSDVFGSWAGAVFLVGAFAVLYSTFFVATAGHARTTADGIRVFRLGAQTPENFRWWVTLLSGALPFFCLAIYVWNKNPVTLVLISGMAQAVMLPMLGGAALYYRYRRADPRITPGRVWDFFLILSFVGLLIAGIWGAWQQVQKLLG
jgi:Mn2+/Fe2+ NRAMP family transporter